MKKLIIIIAVLLTVACSTTPQMSALNIGSCSSACAHLKELKCPEGDPVNMQHVCTRPTECKSTEYCDKGSCHATCEQFCGETEANGVGLNTYCVQHITTCDQVDTCTILAK